MDETHTWFFRFVYFSLLVFLIVLTASRKQMKGKGWLIAHLSAVFALMAMSQVPELLFIYDFLDDGDLLGYFQMFMYPKIFIQLFALSFLFPYVLIATEDESKKIRKKNHDYPPVQEKKRFEKPHYRKR